MEAIKLSERIKISPVQVKYYLSKGYTIFDDNGEYISDPIGYANKVLSEVPEKKTTTFRIINPKAYEAEQDYTNMWIDNLKSIINQTNANMDYIAMMSGIEI